MYSTVFIHRGSFIFPKSTKDAAVELSSEETVNNEIDTGLSSQLIALNGPVSEQ